MGCWRGVGWRCEIGGSYAFMLPIWLGAENISGEVVGEGV